MENKFYRTMRGPSFIISKEGLEQVMLHVGTKAGGSGCVTSETKSFTTLLEEAQDELDAATVFGKIIMLVPEPPEEC
jgi:hypothetical protein